MVLNASASDEGRLHSKSEAFRPTEPPHFPKLRAHSQRHDDVAWKRALWNQKQKLKDEET